MIPNNIHILYIRPTIAIYFYYILIIYINKGIAIVIGIFVQPYFALLYSLLGLKYGQKMRNTSRSL